MYLVVSLSGLDDQPTSSSGAMAYSIMLASCPAEATRVIFRGSSTWRPVESVKLTGADSIDVAVPVASGSTFADWAQPARAIAATAISASSFPNFFRSLVTVDAINAVVDRYGPECGECSGMLTPSCVDDGARSRWPVRRWPCAIVCGIGHLRRR